MSIALILQILFMYQQDYLYKWLPPRRQPRHRRDLYRHLRLRLHPFPSASSRRSRSSGRAPTRTQDFIVGLLMFLLVMELSRLAHPILFWINVVLVVYTL